VRELLAPSILDDTPFSDKEIIYADYGLLTPVRNAEVLAEAMKTLYNGKDLQQIYKVKNFSRAKDYDISVIMDSFKNSLNAEYPEPK
jgi:glycosyltransferase involved in cell wall biosynthesis